MPIVEIAIPDTKDNILRPITRTVVNDIADLYNIKKEIKILYPDESGVEKQTGSSLTDKGNKNVDFGADDLLTIDVKEELFKEVVMAQPTWFSEEYPPIFKDDNLNITIAPVYRESWLTFEFIYRADDKTKAMKWRDEMSFTFINYRNTIAHVLNYHYIIPEEIIYVLSKIHEKIEKIDGYGLTFDEYLKSHFDTRLTNVTDPSGKHSSLAIAEYQTNVFGDLDTEAELEKGEKNDNNSTWEVRFTYKIHFSRITLLNFTYPQVVHQQPLEYPLVPKTTYVNEKGEIEEIHTSNYPSIQNRNYAKSYGLIMATASYFPRNEMEYENRKGIKIPSDDEFYPDTVVPGTRNVMTLQLLFEENEKDKLNIDLMDLKKFSDKYYFEQDILNFMYGEAKYMNIPSKSVFQVTLYNQWGNLDYRSIYVDNELIIRNNNKINLRNNYHIRFGVYYDLSLLDPDALDRLEKSGLKDKIVDKNQNTGENEYGQDQLGTAEIMKTVSVQALEGYQYE